MVPMAVVKGSKLQRMVVVPHRPWYRGVIYVGLCLATMGATGWLAYQFGVGRGVALNVEVAGEDEMQVRLADAQEQLQEMRRKITAFRVGGEIDDESARLVRIEIRALQDIIASQNEEISFYKRVLAPADTDEGLRIDRFDITPNAGGRVAYTLLLTQVVDEHDYVEGGLEIFVLGDNGGEEKRLMLSELDKGKENVVPFRFLYFQNISGEMQIPDGFEPREVLIVARSTEPDARTFEKRIDWSAGEG